MYEHIAEAVVILMGVVHFIWSKEDDLWKGTCPEVKAVYSTELYGKLVLYIKVNFFVSFVGL